MVTGLGMTETAPFMLCANWPDGFAGLVGVPAPGIDSNWRRSSASSRRG